MALIDITSLFEEVSGKYEYEFDSCTGVVQLERESNSQDGGFQIYAYLPGMPKVCVFNSTNVSLMVDLEFHEGMKLRLVSSTMVTKAKLLRDED